MNRRQKFCLFCAGWLLLGGGTHVLADMAESPGPPDETTVVLRVSKQLFDDLVQEPIEDRIPIDQYALGARSIGVAESKAQFRITLKPLREQARFLIDVTGQKRTSTVAHSRSVCIPVGSSTQFGGHAFVYFDGLELHVGDVELTADTRMWFGRVSTTRRRLIGRLVRGIAQTRAYRNKPQAIQLMRETTKAEIGQRFDQEFEDLQQELGQVTPLERTVNLLFPETQSWVRHLSTTKDYLQASVGPKDFIMPALPPRGDRHRQAAIELWVRLPMADPRFDRLALLWNGAQRKLNRLSTEGVRVGPVEIDKARATRIGTWWVFDLHTAVTRPNAQGMVAVKESRIER